MNVENILKVADEIEQKSLKGFEFDMNDWGSGCDCGTSACIAGWSVALRGLNPVEIQDDYWDEKRKSSVADVARQWLGLSEADAKFLFTPEDVDDDIRQQSIKSAHAVAVLRHLAATGEIDWTVGAPQTEESRR